MVFSLSRRVERPQPLAVRRHLNYKKWPKKKKKVDIGEELVYLGSSVSARLRSRRADKFEIGNKTPGLIDIGSAESLMKSTYKNSTVDLVGIVAVTALKPCRAWAADQLASPFIGMDQVTRNGP